MHYICASMEMPAGARSASISTSSESFCLSRQLHLSLLCQWGQEATKWETHTGPSVGHFYVSQSTYNENSCSPGAFRTAFDIHIRWHERKKRGQRAPLHPPAGSLSSIFSTIGGSSLSSLSLYFQRLPSASEIIGPVSAVELLPS